MAVAIDVRIRNQSRCQRASERGVIIVMSVLLLVCLVGVAALVVDISYAYQLRRKAQSAADASALAGGYSLNGTSSGATAATTVVKDYALQNFGVATTAWSGCTDSGKLAVTATGTECISFTANYKSIRVKMPPNAFRPFVALNKDNINISAIAEAGQSSSPSTEGVMPYAQPSTATAGHVCLKTGSNGHSNDGQQGPCIGSTHGSFGTIEISVYGNNGRTQKCSASTSEIKENVILGADHGFAVRASGDPVRKDRDVCGGSAGPANNVKSEQGNGHGGAVDDGFIAGAGGYAGRLTRTQTGTPYSTRTVRSTTMDDTPLWHYIPTTLSNPTIPLKCVRSGWDTLGAVAAEQRMHDCLADYHSGNYNVALFTVNNAAGQPAIGKSARLVGVPMLVGWPAGAGDYDIAGFSPMYINKLYFKCNGNGCATTWIAGFAPLNGDPKHSEKAEAVTGFLLKASMLPTGVTMSGSGISVEGGVGLTG